MHICDFRFYFLYLILRVKFNPRLSWQLTHAGRIYVNTLYLTVILFNIVLYNIYVYIKRFTKNIRSREWTYFYRCSVIREGYKSKVYMNEGAKLTRNL